MTHQKILVVDDDFVIRKALSEFLTAKGYKVEMADNGETGLESFLKDKPDLVILDIVMPVMGGIECLEKIRLESSDTPVIVLTGFGTEEQVSRLNDLGVSDIVPKGTSFEDFLAVIDETIRTRQFHLAPLPEDPSAVKILIADDDTVIRSLLAEFLVEKGFNVLSARDGRETEEVINREKPAIVFLDLVMPEKDGRAILKSLAPEVREAIRWIFITANRHKVKEMRDVGVPYGILEKPFSLVKFERTVKDLFKDLEIKI